MKPALMALATLASSQIGERRTSKRKAAATTKPTPSAKAKKKKTKTTKATKTTARTAAAAKKTKTTARTAAPTKQNKKDKYVPFHKKKLSNHNIDLSKCVVPPRTLERVAITNRTSTTSSQNFSLASKERMALLTSNYSHWLVHVAAAVALRRVRIEFQQTPFPVPQIESEKEIKKKRKRGATAVDDDFSRTHRVEVLEEDVEHALLILQSDTELKSSQEEPRAKPKTMAAAFLLHTTALGGSDGGDGGEGVRFKTMNPLFLRR